MTMLTACELEFLASLRASWRKLYLIEIARLMKEDDAEARPTRRSLTIPKMVFITIINAKITKSVL